jgi:hypothetical protein
MRHPIQSSWVQELSYEAGSEAANVPHAAGMSEINSLTRLHVESADAVGSRKIGRSISSQEAEGDRFRPKPQNFTYLIELTFLSI